jgi:hypothetical protein
MVPQYLYQITAEMDLKCLQQDSKIAKHTRIIQYLNQLLTNRVSLHFVYRCSSDTSYVHHVFC